MSTRLISPPLPSHLATLTLCEFQPTLSLCLSWDVAQACLIHDETCASYASQLFFLIRSPAATLDTVRGAGVRSLAGPRRSGAHRDAARVPA